MGEDSSASLITFGAIWILFAIALGHALSIYKIGFVHESGLYIILGLFGGAMWLLFGPPEVTEYNFSPDMFFDVVLPPIIFAASYNLKRRQFMNNFFPIMVLAIFGAIVNFLLMAMIGVKVGPFGLDESEIMLFAATMSATDGIAVVALIDAEAYPTIFGTLIGEGCINDAVAIILYSSIDSLSGTNSQFGFNLVDLGNMFIKVLETAAISISIGIGVGLTSALYFKFVRMQPTPKTELTLVFLFGYLAYSISDLCGESGIIAVFFCGVCMSHYTYHSLTHESQEASRESFEALSYAGETFIYISLGFYTFSYTDSANWSFPFLITMLTILIVGRVVVVGVCVLFINIFSQKDKRIGIKKQMVFWWGGIVRGAICFALSLRKTTTHSPIIVTTTFAIVIITTFLIGSLTETFLICIGMKDPDPTAASEQVSRKTTAIHEISGCKALVVNLDEKYLKPLFGKRKRRMHEYSMDNPEFAQSYQKYQTKQIQKAVSTTRLWASAGPVMGSYNGGSASYGGAHQSPTNTMNVAGSPPTATLTLPSNTHTHSLHNDRYGHYETVRTVRHSNHNGTDLSHSIGAHQYRDNQNDNDHNVDHESADDLSTDDDMRSNLIPNNPDEQESNLLINGTDHI